MNREELMYGYLMQSLTPEEEEQFVSQLANDLSFAKEYERVLAIWDASSHSEYTSPKTIDVAANWEAFEKQMTPITPVRQLKRNYFRTFYRVAAVVLLVLSFYFFVVNQWNTRLVFSWLGLRVYKPILSVQGLVRRVSRVPWTHLSVT